MMDHILLLAKIATLLRQASQASQLLASRSIRSKLTAYGQLPFFHSSITYYSISLCITYTGLEASSYSSGRKSQWQGWERSSTLKSIDADRRQHQCLSASKLVSITNPCQRDTSKISLLVQLPRGILENLYVPRNTKLCIMNTVIHDCQYCVSSYEIRSLR